MSLNYSALFTKIQQLVAADRAVSVCMGEIVAVCSQDLPHADWSRLSTLDYDGDLASFTSWIAGVFEKQPAPFPIQGLWIGLCNPSKNGKVWADMYVGSLAQYAADDEELGWLWKGKRHYPDDAYAHSASLRSIYQIGYEGGGGLGHNAEWPLCLAFAAFAVRSLLRDKNTGLVASTAPRIGVAVGFDGGDMLKIGELTDRGFLAG
ncbi:MAG TPA: hypothetical protein VFC07_03740 [Verrucomicrobiae bacterium]|nr:hypothetical protein [Verrucomicrobiae bacterium]